MNNKLEIVSAHTMDFCHFFKIQYSMMKLYEPNIKLTVAKSNTIEQFADDVTWVDVAYPDYLHEKHRNYTMKFNLVRAILAQMAKAERVAWADADILPLGPGMLSEFMTMSEKPTVATNVHMGEHLYNGWYNICEWYGLNKLPCYNCGLVAAQRTDSFWYEWANTKKSLYLSRLNAFLEDTGPTHYGVPVRMFFIDQIALNILIDKNPDRFHYVDSSYNWQPLDPNGDVFKDTVKMPFNTKILHLSGPSKKSILIDMETVNV